MTSRTFLLILLIGAWWSLLLVDWVIIEDQGIIGADLNQTMALLPAVGLLALMISLYRRLPRLLSLLSAVAIASASTIALLGDVANSPAVVALKEKSSGIAGGGELVVELTGFAMVFGATGLCIAIAVLIAGLGQSKTSPRPDQQLERDTRDLWDDQS